MIILIYFVFLYMATMFQNSIRDRTKYCYQSKRYPQTKFWKVCRRSAYVSPIGSKPCCHQTNYQKIKRSEPATLRSRSGRIETAVLVKTRKGKHVSVERKQGECYQWKAKGQCTKGNACSFRHDENERGKAKQSSSLCPNRQATSLFCYRVCCPHVLWAR